MEDKKVSCLPSESLCDNYDKPPLVRRIASRGRNCDAKAAALQTRLTRATKQEWDRASGGRFEIERLGSPEGKRGSCLCEQAPPLCHSEPNHSQVEAEKFKVSGEESPCTMSGILRAKNNCHPQNDVTANEPLTLTLSRKGRGNNINASLEKADCEQRARTPFELTKCQVKWRGDAHGGEEPAEQFVDPLNASNQAEGVTSVTEGLKLWNSSHVKNLLTYLLTPVKNLESSNNNPKAGLLWCAASRNANQTPTPNLTSRKTILNCFARQSPQKRGRITFTLAEVFTQQFIGYRKAAFTLAEVFSPHSVDQRKIAFTLAEVLITLGIIGVVAAMTLPAIVQEHRHKALEVGLARFYSTINQAFIASEVDNGEQCYWDYNDNSCEFFEKYLKKYLQITRYECGYYNKVEEGVYSKIEDNRFAGIYFNSGDMAVFSYGTMFVYINKAQKYYQNYTALMSGGPSDDRTLYGTLLFPFQIARTRAEGQEPKDGVEPSGGLKKYSDEEIRQRCMSSPNLCVEFSSRLLCQNL